MRRQKGSFLLSLVFSLAVMGLLYFIITKTYFNNPAGIDPNTRKALREQGVDTTTNMAGTAQRAQDAAKKANELIQNREQEAQSILEQKN